MPAPLRISGTSDPGRVAGAIIGILRDSDHCELSAIGPNAVNQSVKAIAIARGFAASVDQELVCVPTFMNVTISGEEKTAIKFVVEAHDGAELRELRRRSEAQDFEPLATGDIQ